MNEKNVINHFHNIQFFLGNRKVMKKAENPELEEALYTWFLQQRNNHIPISSEILKAKAKFFYVKMTGKDDFSASSGWLDKFKLRHGIRYLKICGEKVSSDESAIEPFKKKFADIVAEMDLSEEQVYNADESAAFWRVLPGNTWVHTKEKSAPGRKISKDRVTFSHAQMLQEHINCLFWLLANLLIQEPLKVIRFQWYIKQLIKDGCQRPFSSTGSKTILFQK